MARRVTDPKDRKRASLEFWLNLNEEEADGLLRKLQLRFAAICFHTTGLTRTNEKRIERHRHDLVSAVAHAIESDDGFTTVADLDEHLFNCRGQERDQSRHRITEIKKAAIYGEYFVELPDVGERDDLGKIAWFKEKTDVTPQQILERYKADHGGEEPDKRTLPLVPTRRGRHAYATLKWLGKRARMDAIRQEFGQPYALPVSEQDSEHEVSYMTALVSVCNRKARIVRAPQPQTVEKALPKAPAINASKRRRK